MTAILVWDRQALFWINGHHYVWLDAILAPISYAGECGALWFAVCLALLAFGKREHRITGLVLLLTIVLVDRLVAAPLGQAFFRQRPYLALDGVRQLGHHWAGSSFPSGHADSVWEATIILGHQWRLLLLPLIAFSLLTCYSRPYLGMHYPLDVLAGSALGIAAGLAVVGLRLLLRRRAEARAR